MNADRTGLLDALASRYVLGTMSARARRRFEHRLGQSPSARSAVARWNDTLAPLAAVIPPVPPPPHVWDGIAARVLPAQRRAPRPSGWRRFLAALSGPLAGPLAGFALGALVAVGIVNQQPHAFGMHQVSAALPASYVGILADDGGDAVLAIGSHRHGMTMKVKVLRPFAVPAGRVARLWGLPRDGGAPVAIGNVPAAGSATIELPVAAEDRFANVAKLGVTFEADPAAAAPTTPFVFAGHCVKFW